MCHLVGTGYLDQVRSERDWRSVRIRAREKGTDLCAAWSLLRGLERVWSDEIQFG